MTELYPIKTAEYVISALGRDQYPEADRPEIAFAGRSNVGKSTMINRLVNRRKLARTSSTPGRTQAINFFNINDMLYFVDLPGYGYAKVPTRVRAQWGPMVEAYLGAGRDIRAVVLIMDIRRDPREDELNLVAWLAKNRIRPIITATKTDKIKRSQHGRRLEAIRQGLGLAVSPLPFSGLSGEGLPELGRLLAELVEEPETSPETSL